MSSLTALFHLFGDHHCILQRRLAFTLLLLCRYQNSLRSKLNAVDGKVLAKPAEDSAV